MSFEKTIDSELL